MPRPLPHESAYIRQTVFEAGVWQWGEFRFASGQPANNKVDMQRLIDNPKLRKPAVTTLAAMVLRNNPDALFGVPSGGQELATLVSYEAELLLIKLVKKPSQVNRKRFDYMTTEDAERAQDAKRIAAIEDVTTTFTSLLGALELPDLREKTHYAATIWRRGDLAQELELNVPIEGIIEEPVPNILTPDHPFFQRYGHLAWAAESTASQTNSA